MLEVASTKLGDFQPHLYGITSNLELAWKTKYEIEIPTMAKELIFHLF